MLKIKTDVFYHIFAKKSRHFWVMRPKVALIWLVPVATSASTCAGVNQRKCHLSPSRKVKAVSEKLFSLVIFIAPFYRILINAFVSAPVVPQSAANRITV